MGFKAVQIYFNNDVTPRTSWLPFSWRLPEYFLDLFPRKCLHAGEFYTYLIYSEFVLTSFLP